MLVRSLMGKTARKKATTGMTAIRVTATSFAISPWGTSMGLSSSVRGRMGSNARESLGRRARKRAWMLLRRRATERTTSWTFSAMIGLLRRSVRGTRAAATGWSRAARTATRALATATLARARAHAPTRAVRLRGTIVWPGRRLWPHAPPGSTAPGAMPASLSRARRRKATTALLYTASGAPLTAGARRWARTASRVRPGTTARGPRPTRSRARPPMASTALKVSRLPPRPWRRGWPGSHALRTRCVPGTRPSRSRSLPSATSCRRAAAPTMRPARCGSRRSTSSRTRRRGSRRTGAARRA
mmetsp:Transcript_29051/g.68911  ORF Transcript_29051/g.68911 Transcript_29051/m.68911 type:complete len:301 (-) Transcript_29051:921-1823(-)